MWEENLCDEENLGEGEVQEAVKENDLEVIEGVPNVSTPLEYGPHKKTQQGRRAIQVSQRD